MAEFEESQCSANLDAITRGRYSQKITLYVGRQLSEPDPTSFKALWQSKGARGAAPIGCFYILTESSSDQFITVLLF